MKTHDTPFQFKEKKKITLNCPKSAATHVCKFEAAMVNENVQAIEVLLHNLVNGGLKGMESVFNRTANAC